MIKTNATSGKCFCELKVQTSITVWFFNNFKFHKNWNTITDRTKLPRNQHTRKQVSVSEHLEHAYRYITTAVKRTRINSYNAQKYLTSDLNNITKEMSYLFPTLNSNNQLSFGQTVTPKCTNNLFRMKDKINTSRMSTKQGDIVNIKWRCKGRRPLHGSPKLRYKFKELNKLNNQIEKMSVMNTSTQPLVMAPLVGIPPSSCHSCGSNNTNFCTSLYKLVGDLMVGCYDLNCCQQS